MTTTSEYRNQNHKIELPFRFCCTNPGCGHVIFKTTKYDGSLHCPYCDRSLVLEEQYKHDLKLQKSRLFLQNLLLNERINTCHFLEYNRPETRGPEPEANLIKEMKTDDARENEYHSPELAPKPMP
ncbi:hypothetical protein L3V82_07715 [Thiotrichales bacterium 19S3-7]|nr:hypothetical protein [Thiotrichales bacterium 19S3-7]MCF6802045.1 hypothetical protein [Thiotrichales bacterium 19S3-11]